MKVKLIDIGRQKVNKTVEVRNSSEIEVEVRKYLLSSDVHIVWLTESTGEVFVGGFRCVGRFEVTG